MTSEEKQAITPEFQGMVFKALWCVLTGMFITVDKYFGGVMLLTIIFYILLKNN